MYDLTLRWKDKDGKYHKKDYKEYNDAAKARKWLVDNGADDVDIAVKYTPPKPKDDE